MTVSSTPITIGITDTFIFHCFGVVVFFSSRGRARLLSLFSLSFSYIQKSAGTSKSINSAGFLLLFFSFFFFFFFFFFLLIIAKSGRLAEIWGSAFISKSQRSSYVSFSRTDSRLCICNLFIWSNLSFLHNSQWITYPIQSSLVLYCFYNNLLNSLCM